MIEITGKSMPKINLLLLFFLSFPSIATNFSERLSEAALHRTSFDVRYDGRYLKLDYPNGDVPGEIGVCTDVVIRSYRSLGIDLQQLVHLDMRDNFSVYPSNRIWGMNKPDTNIDHRRVPNLQRFFARHGDVKTISNDPKDYQAGDLVTWMLPGNLPHIGIIVNQLSQESGHPMIVHNIGAGPKLQDVLFAYPITGHYRFEAPL
jgi:uncharacterized protein YijF (DUF1287 family)